MTNRSSMQTAAVIRYLLVIHELDEDESGARSIDIAARLQVTKPSVHTMLKTLIKKNCATKEKYEAVHLTDEGRALAEQYAQCYELLFPKVMDVLQLPQEECRNAAYAVLSGVTKDTLSKLLDRLRTDPCNGCLRKNSEVTNAENHAQN